MAHLEYSMLRKLDQKCGEQAVAIVAEKEMGGDV